VPEKREFIARFRIGKRRLAGLVSSIRPVPLVPADGKFVPYSGKIELARNLTMIPPVKSHLLPDGCVSFDFDFRKQKALKSKKPAPSIIFGVNPLDIKALDTLDRIFGKVPYYAAKRKTTTIVGAGDFARSGHSFDLFLHDAGMYYLAIVGSEKGAALLKKHRKLFEKCGEQVPAPERIDPTLADPEKLRLAVKNADPSVWEEVARTCLGCGICSYVCPLCYCFETEDKVPVGGKIGARCTRWDSCMLESFSEIAGGHVFQKNLASRIRNWYYHKFARATAERGAPDCVGCGRCFIFCPVAINFREVLKDAGANPRKGN
jgi:sulfhydrogenase subunit beta (sulfur reductase)